MLVSILFHSNSHATVFFFSCSFISRRRDIHFENRSAEQNETICRWSVKISSCSMVIMSDRVEKEKEGGRERKAEWERETVCYVRRGAFNIVRNMGRYICLYSCFLLHTLRSLFIILIFIQRRRASDLSLLTIAVSGSARKLPWFNYLDWPLPMVIAHRSKRMIVTPIYLHVASKTSSWHGRHRPIQRASMMTNEINQTPSISLLFVPIEWCSTNMCMC